MRNTLTKGTAVRLKKCGDPDCFTCNAIPNRTVGRVVSARGHYIRCETPAEPPMVHTWLFRKATAKSHLERVRA